MALFALVYIIFLFILYRYERTQFDTKREEEEEGRERSETDFVWEKRI